MIEVPLDDGSGRYVLVLRVNPDTAPRPVFVQLTARFSNEKRTIFWAPIRMPGSTRPATRGRAARAVRRAAARPAGRGPVEPGGTADPARQGWHRRPCCGLRPALGPDRASRARGLGSARSPSGHWGSWRGALDRSALAEALVSLTRFADSGVEIVPPGRRRQPVASRHPGLAAGARQAGRVRDDRPHRGARALRAFPRPGAAADPHDGQPPDRVPERRPGRAVPRRRLDTAEWAALLDAVAATLTSPAVTGRLPTWRAPTRSPSGSRACSTSSASPR